MTLTINRLIVAAALLLAPGAAVATAQGRGMPMPPAGSPFLRGVPDAALTPGPLRLTVVDVIRRALVHNLGVLDAEQRLDRARGTRWIALSQLLPNVNGTVAETRQKRSLEAFGLPLANGLPAVVGPFNVFDARLSLRQTVLDLRAFNEFSAESHEMAAAGHTLQGSRDFVVLVAANVYLQAIAAEARAETVRAQRDTAQALFTQAGDLRQNGVIAGVDVLRAEVRLATERQRLTAAEHDLQKTKLQLAHIIGLPLGQEFTLSEQMPDVATPDLTLDAALAEAYQGRSDFMAAQEQVKAAEARKRAAWGEALPSVRIDADYGPIGLTPSSSKSTFGVSGVLTVPIFQGNRAHGRLLEADAELRLRRSELEDKRAEVYYDVRAAFLDLQATGEQLQVATGARQLSDRQLTQARDRFAAGVASGVEVIQAQEAVALAGEQHISALYAFNVAKAMLAESLGSAEEAVQRYLGGSRP